MANSGHPIFQGADGRHYHGVRRVLKIPSPAAGADLSLKVPGGVQWRIVLGGLTFAASAAVGNRSPSLAITIEDAVVWRSVLLATVAANATQSVWLQKSNSSVTVAPALARLNFPFPDVWLPDGAIISTSTAGIDAADQWSGINFWLEEQYVTDQGLEQRHIERDEERAAAIAALTAAGVG